MSFTRISCEDLECVLSQVVACEGESPTTIELYTLLRFASANEEPVYLDANDLSILESYM